MISIMNDIKQWLKRLHHQIEIFAVTNSYYACNTVGSMMTRSTTPMSFELLYVILVFVQWIYIVYRMTDLP
jgi:hypothetical protein